MLMQQIYDQTLKVIWQSQSLVPITLDIKYLISALSEITSIPVIEIEIDAEQQLIDSINLQTVQTINRCLNVLEEYLFFEWKISKKYIFNQMMKIVDQYQLLGPKFLKVRERNVKELITKYLKKIENNIFEYDMFLIRLMETLNEQLINDYLSAPSIIELLRGILSNQLQRLAYDIFEFSYIDVGNILLQRIQQILVRIVNEFFRFLLYLSFESNCMMAQMDNLFKKYPSLANSDNYKYMQKEISEKVILNGIEYLRGQCFNQNPELMEPIVKKGIIHFYYLIDIQKYLFSHQTVENIADLMQLADFKIMRPMPQNIQVISSENEICLFNCCQFVIILWSQKVKKNNLMGLKVVIKYKEIEQSFIINLVGHYLMFHQFEQGWVAQADSVMNNQSFLEFLNSEFDYLHQNHEEFQKRVSNERQSTIEIQQVTEFKNAGYKFKKISCPKKPTRYGTSVNTIGAKALGAGLGCLIVDCLDEDIPWEDKVKNAGFTTVTAGVLGVLASKLPLIGLLIQQVILVIAVKSILDNKVISDQESTKNIGHLSVQVSIALGTTIMGSILLPVTFWGAFIGGVIGGVGIGLYGKFVIPYYMSNLMLMLSKSSILIRRNGKVRFKEYTVRKLKIDEKFNQKRKPKNLDDDSYMTLLMFCLVNEVKLVCQAYYHKDMEKLKKKKQFRQMADVLQRQVEREIQLSIWNQSLHYLKMNKISLLHNVESCAEFVEGMLANFKVE